jgi:hypothetical protein
MGHPSYVNSPKISVLSSENTHGIGPLSIVGDCMCFQLNVRREAAYGESGIAIGSCDYEMGAECRNAQ